MSYYPKGHCGGGDEVDDFEDYDPTPYGGGYDIALTYGRPLPPSEETCYPNSSSTSDEFDYNRPQYSSYAQPSAYAEEALNNEYKSYARPKPRPGRPGPAPPSYGVPSEQGDYGFEKPQPNYGFQPGINRPGGGGYGGESEYGGSEGYGRRPEYQKPTSEYESGYGGRPEYERPSSEYGSGGYGRPTSEYGSGGYEKPSSEYGSGDGRKSEYDTPPGSEYQSGGYGRKSEYDEPSSEYGSGYGGYARRPERPSYESQQSEGYGGSSHDRPSYERRSEVEDYRKPRRDDEDEGYGRKKYGENPGYDDEEKKHHGKHHHHHRKDYDDE